MTRPLKSGQRLDNLDSQHCMDVYGPSLTRCVGGRLRVDGFICPHCSSDNPENSCHRPSDSGRASTPKEPKK